MKPKSSTITIRLDENIKKKMLKKNMDISEFVRDRIEDYINAKICPTCGGEVKKR